MTKQFYRVWLTVEQVDEENNQDTKVIEQVELAAFHSLEGSARWSTGLRAGRDEG